METTTINEVIDVAVVFKKSELFPKWFIWKGRKYEINKIEFSWKTKEFPEEKMFFALSVIGGTIFEISFDVKTFILRIEKSTTN